MQKQVIAMVLGSLFSVLNAESANNEKQKNEKQPWSDYQVHDMTRPHPVKVATSGAVVIKPPSDAVVIFDGHGTEALTKAWRVKDGVMIASPGNTSTKKSFGNMQMHVEWRIPAERKVSGQKGGNSGIFLMNQYEIQVMESHTNVTYADGQAAALYGQTPPMVNASAPQGEWQSYDIFFEAPVYGDQGALEPARVTVIHNGVVVHHRQKFYGPTVYRKVAKYPKKHPKKAPVSFQWHKDPVEFRNIWVRECL